MRPRANRAYARLLWLVNGRDPLEQQAIKDDANRLLDAARARGRAACRTSPIAS